MGCATEMAHHPPHRVKSSLHCALGPARRPGDIVARQEEAAMAGRKLVLHEMAEQPALIAVMAGKIAFEGAEEMGVRFP